ncbi:MAG: protein-L-isoaspartate(D-aspartate) O-methyltransferase [Planctomycetota bacterium]|jgi:protein-L-isoaspartate(D-aspartate) O-methyltransferase
MTTRICVTIQFILLALASVCAAADDDYRDERVEMVEVAVVREGITNRAVLQALLKVPRHEFVPSSLHREAYIDKALPIGFQQTISPPYIVAYMTESLDPQPTDRILEIGTGSGYQAAVLGEICKEVYSIEIVPQLGRSAKKRLEKLGYDNVHTKVGDGYKGWPEHAPFDGIIVTCSPESVPQPLVDQLREGGRMIVPLGERYQQVFYLFEKRDGRLRPTKLVPTLFVPMTGNAEERRVNQPDGSKPEVVNGSFEVDENNDDRADNWHYQRQVERVTDEARDGKVSLRFTNDEPGRPAQMLQGLALDGRRVAFVNLSVDVKVDQVTPGSKSYERPALVIHFYDKVRRSLGEGVVGPWLRRNDWGRFGRRIPVPPATREAIVRVGLNGATGVMSIDDVKLSFVPK